MLKYVYIDDIDIGHTGDGTVIRFPRAIEDGSAEGRYCSRCPISGWFSRALVDFTHVTYGSRSFRREEQAWESRVVTSRLDEIFGDNLRRSLHPPPSPPNSVVTDEDLASTHTVTTFVVPDFRWRWV